MSFKSFICMDLSLIQEYVKQWADDCLISIFLDYRPPMLMRKKKRERNDKNIVSIIFRKSKKLEWQLVFKNFYY